MRLFRLIPTTFDSMREEKVDTANGGNKASERSTDDTGCVVVVLAARGLARALVVAVIRFGIIRVNKLTTKYLLARVNTGAQLGSTLLVVGKSLVLVRVDDADHARRALLALRRVERKTAAEIKGRARIAVVASNNAVVLGLKVEFEDIALLSLDLLGVELIIASGRDLDGFGGGQFGKMW
ncbi:hypothetical protein HG531_010288 [Fusarium graminearum]|nr:hypothetical protein HG531_010288 [Fusarium graminearum]